MAKFTGKMDIDMTMIFCSWVFFMCDLFIFELWSILYMADCITFRSVRCDTQHARKIDHTQNRPYLKNWKSHKKLMYVKIIFRAMHIFPENLTTFEQKKFQKNLKEIFALTLTREARVLDPKECGVQGRNPGGGCGGPSRPPNFFFSRMDNFMDKIFFFKSGQIYFNLFQRCVMCWNEFENNFQILCAYFVFDIWSFLYSKLAIFDEFQYKINHNLKNKKSETSEIWFFFRFSTVGIFHEICTTSEGVGRGRGE